MARDLCLLSLSSNLSEGCLAQKGGSAAQGLNSQFHLPADPAGPEIGGERVNSLLDVMPPGSGQGIVLLPTEEVSVRRVEFPFVDSRKIAQVLKFELESELIDEISEYRYDFELSQASDGSAVTTVFLVRRETVDSLSAALRARRKGVQKISCSAQALLSSFPVAQGLIFQVYVGADEAFVSQIFNGQIKTLFSIPNRLPALSAALHGLGFTTPAMLLGRLTNGDNGDHAAASQSAGATEGAELPGAVWAELKVLIGQINWFVETQNQGRSFSLTVHGIYGALLRPDDEGPGVSMAKGESGQFAERLAFGILGDVMASAGDLAQSDGINFFKADAFLLPQLGRMKRAFSALAVLLLLAVVLGGGRFFYQIKSLDSEQEALSRKTSAILSLKPKVTTVEMSAALRKLEQRVARAREANRAEAQFSTYNYEALNLLNGLSTQINGMEGVTIKSLTFNAERISFSGETPSYNQSESLRAKLQGAPFLKGKTPKITHQRSGAQIVYRITVER